MKKVYRLLFSALALVLALAAPAGATGKANTKELTAEQEKQIIQNMTNLEIDEKTQKILLNKVKKGEKVDSEIPENKAKAEKYLAINPNENESRKIKFEDGSMFEQIVSDKKVVKKFTFKDGSAVIESVDTSKGTVSCGTGYCNYKGVQVKQSTVFMSAYFYADFTIINGGDDYISKVYDYYIGTWGNYEFVSFGIIKQQEAWGEAAQAELRWKTDEGGYNTETNWLKLYVGGNDYWSSANYGN
ncbi:hypothetical protein [Effusibacillus consociatus]|uniref:Uncharacterized protein n=1 Tax=Effusibacillus consociatus TaxID=1117041 RepID=A0ABV9Q247_9BACL